MIRSASLLAACLIAQEPATFKVTTPLVLVPATVTDKQGRTVEGLNEADFVLLDNGVPRKHKLEYTLSPISLVVVLEANDRSGAVVRKFQKIGSILQPVVLGEKGSAAIVTFADQVVVWQDFTSSADRLGNRLKKLEPQGRGVILHDALAKAVDMLVDRKDNSKRRAVIVISESKDHGSKTSLAALVTKAQAANVIIYPVTYSAYATAFTSKGYETFDSGKPVYAAYPPSFRELMGELAAAGKENSHQSLAKYTGGMQVNFATLHGLEQVLAKIGEDLHSQYLLSFTPPQEAVSSPEFRKLQVVINGHAEAVVRTRPGYWPEAQPAR